MNPQLNAVYPATGAPSWTFSGEGSISSTPLYADGILYVATNGRHVYALDAQTGKRLWTFTGDDMIMSQPLLDGDTLIVGVGNAQVVGYRPTQYIVLGTGANEIVALSRRDGNAVWSLGIPGTGMPTGIIVNDVFYHLDGSGFLFALDAKNGGYLWRKNVLTTAFMSSINYDSGRFVAVGNWPNRVFAFDEAGNEFWSHGFNSTLSGFSDGPLAIDHGIVIGGYLENTTAGHLFTDDGQQARQHVYALRLADGALLWDRAAQTGTVPSYNMAAIPVIVGDAALIGSAIAPWIHAYDIETGRLLWQRKISGAVKNAPAVTNGVAYFGDLGGCIWALDVHNGQVLGAEHMDDAFNVGSAIIVGQSLIIPAKSGHVYAVPLKDIEQQTAGACTASQL